MAFLKFHEREQPPAGSPRCDAPAMTGKSGSTRAVQQEPFDKKQERSSKNDAGDPPVAPSPRDSTALNRIRCLLFICLPTPDLSENRVESEGEVFAMMLKRMPEPFRMSLKSNAPGRRRSGAFRSILVSSSSGRPLPEPTQPDQAAQSGRRYQAALASEPLNVRPFASADRSIVSPSFTVPARIISASGSCTYFWITRLSGRAP